MTVKPTDGLPALFQLDPDRAEWEQYWNPETNQFDGYLIPFDTESAVKPTPCVFGDSTCPCQDGDQCHYEGASPMKPYTMIDGHLVNRIEAALRTFAEYDINEDTGAHWDMGVTLILDAFTEETNLGESSS